MRLDYLDVNESEHLHEFVEIVYILSGNGVHGIDGMEYDVTHGSLLFINYRQVHHFRTNGKMKYLNIFLDPQWISEKIIDTENAFQLLTVSAFGDFQCLTCGQPLLSFTGSERIRLEGLLKQMKDEYAGQLPGYETVLKAQTNILLTLIFRKMLPDESRTDFYEYIRTHCDRHFTLEELARQCCYNPSYFSRMFRKQNGMTVTEFIRQIRMDKAMELLRTTTLSVEEIADEVGFSNKTVFYRNFREVTGCTPQEWRSKNMTFETSKNMILL